MNTARHRNRRRAPLRLLTALVVAGGGAVLLTVLLNDSADPATEPSEIAASEGPCDTTVRIVAASSYEPVLTSVAPRLASGEACGRLEIEVADGAAAAERAAELNADLWIPDDAAWASVAGSLQLDPDAFEAGTVVATSPIYMVTDEAAAEQIRAAGGGWRALGDVLVRDSGVRLLVRDPAGSGAGLVGAGAVAEAAWLNDGMIASSEVLMSALPAIETVADDPLPTAAGEVGLVPEYTLVELLAADDGDDGDDGDPVATSVRESTLLTGSDYAAVLRYIWLPTAAAGEDPDVAAALQRLYRVLTDPESDDALAAAGLRRPGGEPLAASAADLPDLEADPFDVLGAHHVRHLFTAWYPERRTSDVLLVIDISGSMAEPAAGSNTPLIEFVRDGILSLAELLPDDSQLALWRFGAQLDPPRDYMEVLPRAAMDEAHREDLAEAVDSLVAEDTGTGLYDTVLAAYLAARESYRDGTPNQVIVFTDGRNQDDPDSITAEQLSEELAEAHDPERPVQLSVISYGVDTDAELVGSALEPVDGYVAPVTVATDVRAVFIHLAVGGGHR